MAALLTGCSVLAPWTGPALAQRAAEPPPEAPGEPPDHEPPRAEPVKRLRLMLLDLSDLRVPEEAQAFEAPDGTFRHTFGSQRRTSAETEPVIVYPEQLEADIVVLAGLSNMRAARRLFPARDWRLLLARTSPADKVAAPPGPPPMSMPTKRSAPGVAMWLQPGVRFSGTDPGLVPGFGAVLRMHSGLGVLWALSPSTPCPSAAVREVAAGGLCPAIEGWIGARTAAGDIALVGGMLPRPQDAVPKVAENVDAPRPAPADARPLGLRRYRDRLVLTGADSREHCTPNADAYPALALVAQGGRLDQLRTAGYVLPIKRPKPPPGPASRPPPPEPPPACALILDVVLP